MEKRVRKKCIIVAILLFLMTTVPLNIPSEDTYEQTDFETQSWDTRDAFYFDWMSNTTPGLIYDRYWDGTYLHVARGESGIECWWLNETSYNLEFIVSRDDGNSYRGVSGDGTYVYCGRVSSGVTAYYFNGTGYELKDTESSYSVYGVKCLDGFIFTAALGSNEMALTFNGTSFTLIDSISSHGVFIDVENKSGKFYVYTNCHLPSHSNMECCIFNGTAFEGKTIQSNGAWSGIYSNNGYVFSTQWEGGLYAYTCDWNGTGYEWTHIATHQPPVGSSIGSVYAVDGPGNDSYVFYGASSIVECVLWNGTSFTLLDRINVSAGGFSRGGMAGFGNFIYPNQGTLFMGWDGTKVITGYGTRFASGSITVAQGMNSSWYDYNNTVPDFENAMNNIIDGGTITIWNGTYPSWGYSKYQMYDGTNPRINIGNLTINGNDSYHSYIADILEVQAYNTEINHLHTKGDTCTNDSVILNDCYFDSSSAGQAVSFSGITNGWINNSVIVGGSSAGCRFHDSSFCNISNCYLNVPYRDWNVNEIYITSSDNITVYNNNLHETGAFGISCLNSIDITIKGNIIKGGEYNIYWGIGIELDNSENILIEDNYIYNYTAGDDSNLDYDNAIRFNNGPRSVTINHNYIHDCDNYGIWCDEGVTWLNVTNNTFWNLSEGIHLGSSYQKNWINIINNTVLDSTIGIHVKYSSGSEITNISDNYVNNMIMEGIYLSSVSDSVIYNNSISDTNKGIYIVGHGDIEVRNNFVFNNSVGISIDSSENNLIYNNYFSNTNNAYDNRESNVWNTTKTLGTNIVGGPYIMGNYWSDYTGTDSDGDGIGNTPYVVSHTTYCTSTWIEVHLSNGTNVTLRPNSDVHNNGWFNKSGGGLNCYQEVNTAPDGNTSYIWAPGEDGIYLYFGVEDISFNNVSIDFVTVNASVRCTAEEKIMMGLVTDSGAESNVILRYPTPSYATYGGTVILDYGGGPQWPLPWNNSLVNNSIIVISTALANYTPKDYGPIIPFGRSNVYVDDNAPSGWYSCIRVHTIQEGINNVTEHGTVYVWAGSYVGGLVNKTINLIGNSSTNTTIDCGSGGTNIDIPSDNVTVSGFKIQNGQVGINIRANYTFVFNNNITGNYCGLCLYNLSNHNIVCNNTFQNNDWGIRCIL